MRPRFRSAMLTYGALGLLAFLTLEGKVRLATLVFLAGFSAKTWIAEMKRRGDTE
jgi:hypothetical protein